MKGYIPKQPKQVKERIEAKLDSRLVHQLEKYCEYLESDRDYIICQALAIAFKRDKGFGEWLSHQPELPPAELALDTVTPSARRGRRSQQPAPSDNSRNGAAASSTISSQAL